MKAFLIAILLCVPLASAQTGRDSKKQKQVRYAVPKYSPSYKRTSRDIGPRPGSRVMEDARTSTFKRVYSRPAGLRLLVRANCSTNLRRGELISKARKLSTASGPVVQIDWEPIRGDKVAFWVVASASRKVTEVTLTDKDGKYVASGSKTSPQEHWEVSKLIVGGVKTSACVNEKKMESHELRLAVINFLNRFSVDFYRRPSDQFVSKKTR